LGEQDGKGGSVVSAATTARVRTAAAAVVVALALVLGAAAASGAAPSAILIVRLVPNAISAGRSALAVVTFDNTSHDPLSNVVVTLTFPPTLTNVGAPAGCKSVGGSKQRYACFLGEVPHGKTVRSFVTAHVISKLQTAQHISVGFTLRVGPGHPHPIITSASAQVLASNDAANKGSCLAKPKTLSATLDEQTTALPSPPRADPKLKLPCTPLAVGVAPKPANTTYRTSISSVDVPKLSRPAVVKLTFANETLPDEKLIANLPPGRTPAFDNPNPLWVLDAKAPGGKRVVPVCKPGPTLPAGQNTCVIKVIATDTGTGPADDFDQGYITLLVQGSGFGDPRYVG
jgi:hypothetical protein